MPGWPSASNPTCSASGCPASPRGMPETPIPLGAVNGLLLRVIKVELKINSPLQCSAVMAQPRATAIVSGLSSEKDWIKVEVGGGHHLASSGTPRLCGLQLPAPWGCHLPGTAHLSPHAPGATFVWTSWGEAVPTTKEPGKGPVPCPTSCPALAATDKASPEIF